MNKKTSQSLPPPNSTSSKIKRPSLRDAVTLQLKEWILNGELKDGQRLNEVDVAKWLGVSRGVVREAIRELETDGILAYEPYRGTFVRGWTAQRVNELYTLRSLLEEFAIDLAVSHVTENDIETLSGLVEAMRQAVIEGSSSLVVELDLEFHRKIYTLSKHSLLIDLLNNLSGQTHLLIMANHCYENLYPALETIADSHVPVLVALLAHDHKRARQEIKAHVQESGERLVQFVMTQTQTHNQKETINAI